MAPTNIKTVHQTSLLHIESGLDRLGLFSPTDDQRSQQQSGKITLPTSFDQQIQVSQDRITKKAASWLHFLKVSLALHPPERPSRTHTPKPSFGGRGHEDGKIRVEILSRTEGSIVHDSRG